MDKVKLDTATAWWGSNDRRAVDDIERQALRAKEFSHIIVADQEPEWQVAYQRWRGWNDE